ncbi:hypothetical protein ACFQVD_26240 [Streptosporangium amethystogenes subsp. fukuiense]|uniref:Uncharacterized protein n=1 Tax=Streptosporangium amethystogenes subsp. fukuiense TaxID=698418 RepID=A0ABW2T501_9ACTN
MTAPPPGPHFRPFVCQKCGLPLERMWSLYIGYFWGTREGDLGPGQCKRNVSMGVAYGPHTPPS